MTLIIQSHGGNAMIIEETDNTHCTISYRRREWDRARQYTYTIEMARKAGLTGGDVWTKYPDNLLRARCIGAVGKMVWPDVIAGMSVPEDFDTDPDAPCDAAAYRRRWFAMVKGTYLEDEAERHALIYDFTHGTCNGLADFLSDATDGEARLLLDRAQARIDLRASETVHNGHQTHSPAILRADPPVAVQSDTDPVNALLSATWAELEKLREEHPKIANGRNAKRTTAAMNALEDAYGTLMADPDQLADVARKLAHNPDLEVGGMTVAEAQVITTAARALGEDEDLRMKLLYGDKHPHPADVAHHAPEADEAPF
jgi:hypothetical protein